MSFGAAVDNRSLSDSLIVNAAFQQSLWSVAPICSGGGVAPGEILLLYSTLRSEKFKFVQFYITACENYDRPQRNSSLEVFVFSQLLENGSNNGFISNTGFAL